ncbi:MAG TPA: WYL domain-containing protein, partial [Capillimicrobium sp.]
RVDRLSRPRSAGAYFTPRELPAEDAARFVESSLAALRSRWEAEVLFHAPADTIDAIMGRWGATVEPDGPDRCVLRTTSESIEWLAAYLGLVGHDFEVRSPPELVEHVARLAERYGCTAAT